MFFQILLNDVVDTFFPFSNEINFLLCAVVVAESCFLSSDENSETPYDADVIL